MGLKRVGYNWATEQSLFITRKEAVRKQVISYVPSFHQEGRGEPWCTSSPSQIQSGDNLLTVRKSSLQIQGLNQQGTERTSWRYLNLIKRQREHYEKKSRHYQKSNNISPLRVHHSSLWGTFPAIISFYLHENLEIDAANVTPQWEKKSRTQRFEGLGTFSRTCRWTGRG